MPTAPARTRSWRQDTMLEHRCLVCGRFTGRRGYSYHKYEGGRCRSGDICTRCLRVAIDGSAEKDAE